MRHENEARNRLSLHFNLPLRKLNLNGRKITQ